ncbi:hypothetical protein ACFQV2_07475 [Actinokineospora soli]|uniref:Uncharacterized protein n=1 Tax=Actinokineospora soli TaxID=1048753 RepID=A0ABW2TJZ9_9PSEU
MIRATRDLGPSARFLGGGDEPGEFQAVVVLLGIVAAAPSLATAVLSAPELDATTPGGLLARRPDDTWSDFAADLRPSDGRSRIAGPVDDAGARRWAALHDGLRPATERVDLPDLRPFHTWAPRILRFSYLSDPNR